MIRVLTMEAPAWDRAEILRYARVREASSEETALLESCIREAATLLSYQVCYTAVDVQRAGERYRFGNMEIASKTVGRTLRGCDRALLFAATVGAPFDRLITRYARLEPSRAMMLHAVGAERAEALCDAFCAAAEEEYAAQLRPRVSPGYGDFPLEMQRAFFQLLDCPRRIGLTLNESLLMSPSKSVTALAGMTAQQADITDEPSYDK